MRTKEIYFTYLILDYYCSYLMATVKPKSLMGYILGFLALQYFIYEKGGGSILRHSIAACQASFNKSPKDWIVGPSERFFK